MGVKVKTIRDDFYKLEKRMESLNGKSVDVGVLAAGEMGWLAGIHEYGCKIKVTDKMRKYLHSQGLHLKDSTTHITIPERSFLRNGFDEHHEEVLNKAEKALGAVIHNEMAEDQFLKMVGLLLKSKIQTYARNLDTPPNHPYTIEQKGSSNPLIDTGHMVDHISFKVNK